MHKNIEYGEIKSHLVSIIAETLRTKPEDIECDIPFSKLDLDSMAVVDIHKRLESLLDMEIEPTVAWDYPTINQMAGYLEEYLSLHGRIDMP